MRRIIDKPNQKTSYTMKKLVTLAFLSVLSLTLSAQKAEIKFDKTAHNFGLINEADGKATCTFGFTNTGDGVLILNNVQTSCGCTAREYTKEPVDPGKTGVVKVTYNPAGRPGPFKKTITVSSNTGKKVVLSIKGEVNPKRK